MSSSYDFEACESPVDLLSRTERLSDLVAHSGSQTRAPSSMPSVPKLRLASRKSCLSSSESFMNSCAPLRLRTLSVALNGAQLIEADVSIEEWLGACALLNEAGKVTSAQRDEMILCVPLLSLCRHG